MQTIGKLALAATVSSDAIRYYEKEGLITPSRKSEAGIGFMIVTPYAD